ncbi:MAG: CocE/NonD family hydrolase [Mycobacterium sp.]
MGASQFVGRVGGLAVALGVGVAVFNGVGVAWADSGSADSGSRGASAAHSDSSNAGPTRARRGGAATAAASRSVKNSGAPAISAVAVDVTPAPAGGAGTGSLPGGDSLALTALAVARRQPSAAVTASSTAQATSSTAITVTSGVTLVDGIFNGAITATSTTGNPLTYAVVGNSCGTNCGVGSSGGKITATGTAGSARTYAILPYANWLDGAAKGSQTFQVRVTETTQFDAIVTSIPLIGTLAAPIIGLLQKTPYLGDLLAPIIGASVLVDLTADVATDAPGDTPVGFTYKVASFDGVEISTNFFPAAGLAAGQTANTVLNGPGLGAAGSTNPYETNSAAGSSPGIVLLRNSQQAGDVAYNVITWDPRGEFQSGGILQLDNPMYEGRDVSAVIDWASTDTPANLNGPNDPVVGMVGGSYGGGIQLATVDPRLDALVPAINWNSLNESLYPDDIFKTAWAATLGLSLLTTGARVNGEIYPALLSGILVGAIRETAQAVLGSSGPAALLTQLQAPTLLQQGTVDALFPLVQSIENAQDILANPYGTPVKMIWFCGGHGVCLDQTQEQLVAQATTMFAYDKAWLNKYVSGVPIPDAFTPNFQWWDQTGTRYTSDLYPFSDGFNTSTPLTVNSDGGTLGILPFAIGGSGPNSTFSFPLNAVFATPAGNAINVPITPTAGQQVVGAPTVSFTYSGIGTAKAVYGQIIDNATGRVLGNIVTQIPVTLDGQTRTVSVPIADIAYTAGSSPSLTLQITSSATLYWNSSWGVANISDVTVSLPVKA